MTTKETLPLPASTYQLLLDEENSLSDRLQAANNALVAEMDNRAGLDAFFIQAQGGALDNSEKYYLNRAMAK